MIWNLADAKNRLSELVTRALTEGPQRVHRRKDEVVVISAAEYARLVGERPSLKEYLTRGVSLEGVDLSRDTSLSRDVEL